MYPANSWQLGPARTITPLTASRSASKESLKSVRNALWIRSRSTMTLSPKTAEYLPSIRYLQSYKDSVQKFFLLVSTASTSFNASLKSCTILTSGLDNRIPWGDPSSGLEWSRASFLSKNISWTKSRSTQRNIFFTTIIMFGNVAIKFDWPTITLILKLASCLLCRAYNQPKHTSRSILPFF